MKIRTIKLKNNLLLAPMQNVTTAPYRRFFRKLNPIGLVCVPMIYTKRVEENPNSILFDLYKIEEERPISVQLIGGDVSSLKISIDFLSSYNYDILDINAGCPSKRAIKANEGGFLLKDLKSLKRILETAIKFSSRPVSVKIRSGYSSSEELQNIIRIIEPSGVDLVTIHSRTVKDRFNDSKFDIESLKFLKENTSIPVIGNGDINTPYRAKEVIDYTKVDGLMIGRASMGNPKIFTQIASFLDHEIGVPIDKSLIIMQDYLVLYEEIIDEINYTNLYSDQNTIEQLKFTELRRNAIWLTKFISNSKIMRVKISKSKSLKDLKLTLQSLFVN
ncbi:MAG: tRNA-dihydrouridine synthase family protein [Candidatus Lokiarchaeota archaeon]